MGRVGRIANATAQFPFIDPASGSDARKDVALHIHQVVPILMGRRRRKEEAKRAYKSTCVEENGIVLPEAVADRSSNDPSLCCCC